MNDSNTTRLQLVEKTVNIDKELKETKKQLLEEREARRALAKQLDEEKAKRVEFEKKFLEYMMKNAK